MKLWKSKKSATASAAGGGTTTGCAGGGAHKGGILSKSCKTLGGGKANGSGSFDEHTAETSFVTPAAAPGTDVSVAVLSSMVQHLPSNLFIGSERAMSPAQSEDSGLAADRGTTYATLSIPRDIGQIGIVLVERTDLSLPPIVESIVGPVGDLLAPGDRIHQVDGISTIGLSNQHICSILDHGEDPAVIEIEYSFPEYISQNSLCVTTKIVQITVERENGCLGLTLRGGGEYPLVVTNVRPNGPVFRAGQIKPGDRVLRVDNISLLNKSLSEAQHILKDAHVSGYTNLTIEYDVSVMQTVELSLGPLLLEIERPLNEKLGLALSYYSNAATHPADPLYHSTYKLNQEVVPDGIYIASIMPASIADRCGALSVGDQILAIDETVIEGGACTLEEATALLDANCVKGYSQLHILPAHTFVRRRGFSYSSPRYGFNTVDSRKQLAGSKHRRLLRKSSLPQPMEDLHGLATAATTAPGPTVGGLCKAEKIHIILDCSQGSGICLGPKTACGRGFVVTQILPDSVAERSGCLQKGDRITAVNKMCNLDVGAVRQILGDFGPVAAANHYHNQPQTSNWVELEVEFDMADTVVPASGVFTIKLLKHGRYGLGITVNGNGSESFVVSEVKPGSAAHRTGSLRAGDVLLAVDNRPLQHYNLDQLLKESSNELITLTVKRTSASPNAFLLDAAQQPKSCSVYGCADEADFAYGHRFQSEEQRLRHPVWSNAMVPYEVSAGDATTPSTEQNLPLPPAHLLSSTDQGDSVGDGDRYDDIMHYKMASMNIANYVGYSAIGSFPKSQSATTGFSHEQPSPPPPPHAQRHQLLQQQQQPQQRVFNVHLEPDGGPLGITLAASEDLQKPIKISALTEGGIAYNTGQLQLGDRLLAINGESIVGIPLTTATKLLQKFDNAVDLQIARPVTPDQQQQQQPGSDEKASAVYAQVQQRPRSPAPALDAAGSSSSSSAGGVNQRTLQVTLFKDRVYDDYGFSVSDGLYERGVYINRIRSGGPADMAGLLRPFDRIVQVNGTKTQDFDCCLTVPLIAAAGDKIELAIQRTLPE